MSNTQQQNRKIVSVENSQSLADLRDLLRASGVSVIKELPLINGFLCELPEEQVLAFRNVSIDVKVEEDIKFKLCSKSRFFFNPPFFPLPIFFKPKPKPQEPPKPSTPFAGVRRVDWGLKRIGANQVWHKLKDNRVRIGIIDTGINPDHPDLRSNFREGISTLDDHSSFLDDYGHGTHVAGIIGAGNNQGMVGINPYVDIFSVKAFDKRGSGNLSDIIEGLDWLLRRNVSIINMSFSTSDSSQSFTRAIQMLYNRGVVLVAAAGNDGGDVNYPARFPEVIAVSAIDRHDRLANFSSHGPEINFCAPGVDINSTWLGSGYAVKSGTSFAAPHVAGAVADVFNYYGYMHPSQVMSMLSEKAVRLGELSKEQQGVGLVELTRLLQ